MLDAKIVGAEICWGQWQIVLAEKVSQLPLQGREEDRVPFRQEKGAGWLQGKVIVCRCVFVCVCVCVSVYVSPSSLITGAFRITLNSCDVTGVEWVWL